MKRSIVGVLLLSFLSPSVQAQQRIPAETLALWESNAPYCAAPDGTRFPSKGDCDDGDVTLFNGLLCGAGDERGCTAVKDALDATGRWWRSPRRAATNNDGHPNSFSPDMGLGVQIYLVRKSDKVAARRWSSWLDDARPCIVGDGPSCLKGLPRFCPDDTEKGCTMRPGDLAVLSETFSSTDSMPAGEIFRGLLIQARGRAPDIVWLDSQVNDAGYSQHLVAVEIFLLQQLLGDMDPKLKAAAMTLRNKQPRNPFFAYLAGESLDSIASTVLALCPTTQAALSTDKDQWAWERADAEQAWRHSALWDCIFMAKLLNR